MQEENHDPVVSPTVYHEPSGDLLCIAMRSRECQFCVSRIRPGQEYFSGDEAAGRLSRHATCQARIDSERQGLTASPWQPMDTAPHQKDVLCLFTHNRARVCYLTDHGEGFTDNWRWPQDGTAVGEWPIRWMHIPPAPQEDR